MKNLLPTLQILAALIFLLILSDSLYSQNVISSVNLTNNTNLIVESLTDNTSNSIVLAKNSNNWMSHKNYLDNSSTSFNYKIMIVLDEKVYESNKEIENWMLDESSWSLSFEKHYKLKQIERWMLDEDFWIIEDDAIENSIENWMIDNNFWVIVN